MKIIVKMLLAIYHRLICILLHIKFLYLELTKDIVYVQYSCFSKNLNLSNRNFGDDINKILVEHISGKKVVPYKFSTLAKLKHTIKFMCIGSVISMYNLEDTIIWGTGILSSKKSISGKPKFVLAVRGPLTRQYLIEHGINCPRIYGDPALLLSRIYTPNIKKKYKLGIISHYLDHKSQILHSLIRKYKNDIIFIDVVNYGHWKEYINKVCSCDFIISSSLHGIIISDAYYIPNYWCQFDFKMDDDGFKFRDYFLSVKKEPYSPLILDTSNTLDEILAYKKKWTPIDIDLDKLYNECPFKKI